MSIPGVGVQTSAVFAAAMDDASRFKRSRDAGAYFGLVPRRHQSGELDWTGRITKQGGRSAKVDRWAAEPASSQGNGQPCKTRYSTTALQDGECAQILETLKGTPPSCRRLQIDPSLFFLQPLEFAQAAVEQLGGELRGNADARLADMLAH
jgi:Transposase IS116/IS110/IS902 family